MPIKKRVIKNFEDTVAIPTYGDKIPMKDFVNHCKHGNFIDYDGFGKYAFKYGMTKKIIRPSDVVNEKYDGRYPFVVWFNR